MSCHLCTHCPIAHFRGFNIWLHRSLRPDCNLISQNFKLNLLLNHLQVYWLSSIISLLPLGPGWIFFEILDIMFFIFSSKISAWFFFVVSISVPRPVSSSHFQTFISGSVVIVLLWRGNSMISVPLGVGSVDCYLFPFRMSPISLVLFMPVIYYTLDILDRTLRPWRMLLFAAVLFWQATSPVMFRLRHVGWPRTHATQGCGQGSVL